MELPSSASVIGVVLGESGAESSGESVADRSTFDPNYAPIGSDLDSDLLSSLSSPFNKSKGETAVVEVNFHLDSSPLWLSDVDESEEMMGAGAGLNEMEDLAYFETDDELFNEVSEEMMGAGTGLNEMEYLAYFEPDDEVFDEVSEAEFELTEEELAVMKEINESEMEADVNTFLLRTENDNTRSSTNAIITKYNRVMAIVAKKQNKKFVTLLETPHDEIPNLLAMFFKMIRTKKGSLYNASSLNTFLSSFGRYFAECYDPPIDLKNDIRFRTVKTTVARMKKVAQGTKDKKPGSNASRAVAPRHLRLAWAQGHIGRDSPDALNSATYLAFTTGLGCRAVREVHAVTNGSLIFGPVGSGGVPEYIELDEQWVTKNRVGKDARLLEARVHPDHEHPEICYVRTIVEMMRRKTERQSLPDAKFWWNVKETARENPKAEEKWFKNNHAGKHSIEKMLINSLTLSGIDCKKEKYTATSTRKSMMDGGQDAGIPETILGRKAGHRSEHSKRSYIQNKDITHRATNIVLSRVGAGKTANYQDVLNKLMTADEAESDEASGESAIIETAKQVEYYDDDFEYTISQSRIIRKEANVANDVKMLAKRNQSKLTEQQMSGAGGLGQQTSGTVSFNPCQPMSGMSSSGQQMMSGMFSPGQQIMPSMFSPAQHHQMSGIFSPGQHQQTMPGLVSPGQHQQMILGMVSPAQQMISGMFSPAQHQQIMPGMVSTAQQMMSGMFSPAQHQQMMPGMVSPAQQMSGMFSPGQHQQMMPGMASPAQQMMSGMFSPGHQQQIMPGMFSPAQQMMQGMFSHGQQMMQGMFNPGQQIVPDMLMMPDMGQKKTQGMVNGSGLLSTEQDILFINSSGLDSTPNTLVGGSSASAYQVPSLKGPMMNSPVVETNANVAEKLKKSVSAAEKLKKSVSAAEKLNKSVSAAEKLNNSTTPAVKLNKSTPPATKLNKSTPPAVKPNKFVPPAVKLNKSVPIAEKLNKSVPPAVKLNKFVPVAEKLNKSVTAAEKLKKSVPAAVKNEKLTGKENIEFRPGSVMLHKLKGIPYWPAKITDVKDGSATLLYFGTGEVGTAKGFRGLFPYTEENKAKYGLVATTKKVLKKAFEEADEEMKIKQ